MTPLSLQGRDALQNALRRLNTAAETATRLLNPNTFAPLLPGQQANPFQPNVESKRVLFWIATEFNDKKICINKQDNRHKMRPESAHEVLEQAVQENFEHTAFAPIEAGLLALGQEVFTHVPRFDQQSIYPAIGCQLTQKEINGSMQIVASYAIRQTSQSIRMCSPKEICLDISGLGAMIGLAAHTSHAGPSYTWRVQLEGKSIATVHAPDQETAIHWTIATINHNFATQPGLFEVIRVEPHADALLKKAFAIAHNYRTVLSPQKEIPS